MFMALGDPLAHGGVDVDAVRHRDVPHVLDTADDEEVPSSALMASVAAWSACIDEPQRRLIVWAGTLSDGGHEARSARCCRPARGSAGRSPDDVLDLAGFTFGFRSRSAWMTAAERVSARTFRNIPPWSGPWGCDGVDDDGFSHRITLRRGRASLPARSRSCAVGS